MYSAWHLKYNYRRIFWLQYLILFSSHLLHYKYIIMHRNWNFVILLRCNKEINKRFFPTFLTTIYIFVNFISYFTIYFCVNIFLHIKARLHCNWRIRTLNRVAEVSLNKLDPSEAGKNFALCFLLEQFSRWHFGF